MYRESKESMHIDVRAYVIQIISIGLLWSQLLLIMDNFFYFARWLPVRAITSFFYTMTSWNMALQSNF